MQPADSEPQRRGATADTCFSFMIGAVVAVAAAIRLAFVLTDDRKIGGDGFSYHFEALRLADGLGYTKSLGVVGAPIAHHPPGWVTLLGFFSWLGARSPLAHQLIAITIGLGVVLLVGLVGRRYFNARVGLLAALLAAFYPGFWLLEGRILSEPLGLLILGCFALAMANLRDEPTLRRSLVAGAFVGLLASVRSELLALILIVVAPVLMKACTPLRQRCAYFAVAALACAVILAPWSIYNTARFGRWVILSTNGGGTLLEGNCPQTTYDGERIGYFDATCDLGLIKSERAVEVALHNIVGNLAKLPLVVVARFGRMLAVFRPAQTVDLTAQWMNTETWLIWAWVGSYWLLLPLAVAGSIVSRHQGRFLVPLLGPLLLECAAVAVTFGEPRYHAMGDLGILVLAAVAVDSLLFARQRALAGSPEQMHEGQKQ